MHIVLWRMNKNEWSSQLLAVLPCSIPTCSFPCGNPVFLFLFSFFSQTSGDQNGYHQLHASHSLPFQVTSLEIQLQNLQAELALTLVKGPLGKLTQYPKGNYQKCLHVLLNHNTEHKWGVYLTLMHAYGDDDFVSTYMCGTWNDQTLIILMVGYNFSNIPTRRNQYVGCSNQHLGFYQATLNVTVILE